MPAKDVAKLVEKIKDEYSVHLMADGLPVATPFKNINTQLMEYEIGYKLGTAVEQDKKMAVSSVHPFPQIVGVGRHFWLKGLCLK